MVRNVLLILRLLIDMRTYKNNPIRLRFTTHHHFQGLDSITPVRDGFCQFSDIRYMVYESALIFMVNYKRFKIDTYDSILKHYFKQSYSWTLLSHFTFLPHQKPGTILEYAQLIFDISRYLSPDQVKKLAKTGFTVENIKFMIEGFNFSRYAC